MAASSEQAKSKKKQAARVRIHTLQPQMLGLWVGMATLPSKYDGEYYHRKWQSILEDTAAKIEKHWQQCQEIEDKIGDNEFNNDDESMGSVTHIPTETGVNNNDTELMSMDENDNDDDNDEEDQ